MQRLRYKEAYTIPLCFVAVTLAMFSGCKQESHTLANVSGRITKSGKPVASANVTFQPMANKGTNSGPGSVGKTDEQGRYELKTFNDQLPGAVIGRHRVIVYLSSADGKETPDGVTAKAAALPPLRFRDGSIEIDVPNEGLTTADFDLDK
jgi:hypothetical protein